MGEQDFLIPGGIEIPKIVTNTSPKIYSNS